MIALLLATLFTQETRPLTILSTADLHGHLHPVDYAANQPAERGLAKAATLIRRARAEGPPTLLIDAGDTIAGSALAFHQDRRAVPAIIAAMNELAYDAMVLGNHELDFGWPYLNLARRASRFPWLAANTNAEPYVIKDAGGIRVGVLGLTTTAIPNVARPEEWRRRLNLHDAREAARRHLPGLRARVDVLVVAMHMGVEQPAGQVKDENLALDIAREFPMIDLILMGHTHREVPSRVENGVLLMQAASWGRGVARADLVLERQGGGWRVRSKQSRALSVQGVEPDPVILRLSQAAHDATQAWLDQRLGPAPAEPLLAFVHRVQREAGRAPYSFTEGFAPTALPPAGELRVRHLFGLYGVEKTVVTLEMTGAQIRAVLAEAERCARDPQCPPYLRYDFSGDADALAGAQRVRVAANNYLANQLTRLTIRRRSKKDLRELLIDAARRRRVTIGL